jgi:hypothetical protein
LQEELAVDPDLFVGAILEEHEVMPVVPPGGIGVTGKVVMAALIRWVAPSQQPAVSK